MSLPARSRKQRRDVAQAFGVTEPREVAAISHLPVLALASEDSRGRISCRGRLPIGDRLSQRRDPLVDARKVKLSTDPLGFRESRSRGGKIVLRSSGRKHLCVLA
jgi:hypothetical protein